MVQMIAGVYGRYREGRVEPVRRETGPVDLGEAEEARLVGLGVAEYVDGPGPSQSAVPTAPPEGEATRTVGGGPEREAAPRGKTARKRTTGRESNLAGAPTGG